MASATTGPVIASIAATTTSQIIHKSHKRESAMIAGGVPTWLNDMAVSEDDAAGLVNDEPGGVAGAGDLGVKGARRGCAEDDDGWHNARERAAPVLRRDRRLDLHRQLPAGLLLRGALHRQPRSNFPFRRPRFGQALRRSLGFWARARLRFGGGFLS